MTDRFQHYQGYELLLKKLDEGVRRYEKTRIPVVSGFMGPDKLNVIRQYLGNTVPYELFGGYEEAFSKILIIGEDEDIKEHIVCLKAEYNPKFVTITHRDVLGTVFSLGIDESSFGDMWVDDGSIYLYVTREISSYVVNNMTRIRNAHVQFRILDDYPAQQFKYRTFTITVSSYRLDRILATSIRKSRQKCQEMIRNSLINVNYQTIEDCDFLCHNGDILSVRGVGRFQVGEEVTSTRSGNVIIEMKQFV